MQKYVMVRSPKALVAQNKIGVGWSQVDFSKFENIKELMTQVRLVHPNLGYQRKKIERFFSLSVGDIVIVPVYKSIYLAIVSGEKMFNPVFNQGHGANQIKVNYIKNSEGKPKRFNRSYLTEGFERRLKVPQASLDLNEFKTEIDKLLKEKDQTSLEYEYLEKVAEHQSLFEKKLLSQLQNGKTRLDGGGRGLEKLIKELLLLEGYIDVSKPSLQSGIADVDIIAKSANSPLAPTLLIQAKHHSGETNGHAIRQLVAYEYEDDINTQRWVITTADINDNTAKEAENQNVNVLMGSEFVTWLCQHLEHLSENTKARLGLNVAPSFV